MERFAHNLFHESAKINRLKTSRIACTAEPACAPLCFRRELFGEMQSNLYNRLEHQLGNAVTGLNMEWLVTIVG
jgi:hypothetical protein